MALGVNLSPGEGVSEREFTDPDRSLDDLAAVARLRASLAARVRSGLAGGVWASAGESHWLVVPELRGLVESRPAFGVGFFGQAREQVDHTPILDLEQVLVARAAVFPGMLAYYNVRFATGQWGNLVLFTTQARGRARAVGPDARGRTRTCSPPLPFGAAASAHLPGWGDRRRGAGTRVDTPDRFQ